MVFPRPTSSASSAPLRERGLEGEQGRVDLVGIQINLSTGHCSSELFDAVR